MSDAPRPGSSRRRGCGRSTRRWSSPADFRFGRRRTGRPRLLERLARGARRRRWRDLLVRHPPLPARRRCGAARMLGRPPVRRRRRRGRPARHARLSDGEPRTRPVSARAAPRHHAGATSATARRSRSAPTRTTGARSCVSSRTCSTSRATSTASGSSSSCGAASRRAGVPSEDLLIAQIADDAARACGPPRLRAQVSRRSGISACMAPQSRPKAPRAFAVSNARTYCPAGGGTVWRTRLPALRLRADAGLAPAAKLARSAAPPGRPRLLVALSR